METTRLSRHSIPQRRRPLRWPIGIFCLVPAGLWADSDVAPLDIRVSGISEKRGTIAIAIFDSAETFDALRDPVGRVRLPLGTDRVNWSIELPVPATYAVTVYQDLNDNGEIDMRRFGIPKEPYGFSNNARGTFGPPRFEEARIELDPEGLVIEIEID